MSESQMSANSGTDTDTQETREWKDALAAVIQSEGAERAHFLLEQLHDWLPYFLVVASSSFVYVALADLIPQLQRRLSARETAIQIALLLTGMGVVTLVSGLAHGGH